jgi:hypothetical protein
MIVISRRKFAFGRQFKFSKWAKEKKVGGGYLAIHYFAPRSESFTRPGSTPNYENNGR